MTHCVTTGLVVLTTGLNSYCKRMREGRVSCCVMGQHGGVEVYNHVDSLFHGENKHFYFLSGLFIPHKIMN